MTRDLNELLTIFKIEGNVTCNVYDEVALVVEYLLLNRNDFEVITTRTGKWVVKRSFWVVKRS